MDWRSFTAGAVVAAAVVWLVKPDGQIGRYQKEGNWILDTSTGVATASAPEASTTKGQAVAIMSYQKVPAALQVLVQEQAKQGSSK